MKYCKKCGNEIKDGNNFCIKCGSPINLKIEKNKSKKRKELFTSYEEFNFEYFNDYIKTYPIARWRKLITLSFIFLIIILFSAVIQKLSIIDVIVSYVITMFLFYIFDILTKKGNIIKKYKMQEKQIKDKMYTLTFYEDYIIRTSDNITRKIDYTDIKKIIESDAYFYLIDNISILFLKKQTLNEEQIEFVKNINRDVYHKKGDKIKLKPKTVNKILTFILVLSIISVCSVFQDGLSNYGYIDNIWKLLLLVPLPLLSLILGIKYINKGKEYDARKNIIGGIIILIILLSMYIFSNPSSYLENYNDIYKYEKIISIKLPKKVELIETTNFTTNSYMKNFREYEFEFSGKNQKKLENDIKNSEKWINSSNFKSSLNIFIENNSFSNTENYYLIYNSTLDEYNSLPNKSGEYKYYIFIFNTYNKRLVIYEYNYLYKN